MGCAQGYCILDQIAVLCVRSVDRPKARVHVQLGELEVSLYDQGARVLDLSRGVK